MGKEVLLKNLGKYFEEAYKTIDNDKSINLNDKLEMQEVVKNFSILASRYEECVRNMHIEELKEMEGNDR